MHNDTREQRIPGCPPIHQEALPTDLSWHQGRNHRIIWPMLQAGAILGTGFTVSGYGANKGVYNAGLGRLFT